MQRASAHRLLLLALALPLSCESAVPLAAEGPEPDALDLSDEEAPSSAPDQAPASTGAARTRVREDRLETLSMRSLVTSTATVEDGSRYVAGVFGGTLLIGGFKVESHGGDDIFVAGLRPSGVVAWAHAIGSKHDESDPKVTFSDGRVKLVGMTDGAVDCGQGPLNTWSSETFFFCTFERDGTPINGATFPTGRR